MEFIVILYPFIIKYKTVQLTLSPFNKANLYHVKTSGKRYENLLLRVKYILDEDN